jgi:hypothetical protein
MSTNPAADRLRVNAIYVGEPADETYLSDLDEALATERRATVERIRPDIRHALIALDVALDKMAYRDTPESDLLEAHATLDSLLAILDAEADAMEVKR